MNRIGILAGTFDPVHKGHIAFALQAKQAAKLSGVYFLPEIQPRRKSGVTHIAHRTTMLNQALKPYNDLIVLELPDREFSVAKTLPRLQKKFPDSELFFLIGADKELTHLVEWPLAGQLLKTTGLIIAQRKKTRAATETLVKQLPQVPNSLYILETKYADISSGSIRDALFKQLKPRGAVASTLRYADKNWLYSVVSSNVSS